MFRVSARGLLLGLFVHLEAVLRAQLRLRSSLTPNFKPAEPFGFQLDRIAVHEWI